MQQKVIAKIKYESKERLFQFCAIRNPVLANRHFCRHTVKKPPPGLLQFKTMSKRFPWHLVILLGSGFALAEACKVTWFLIHVLLIFEKKLMVNAEDRGLNILLSRPLFPFQCDVTVLSEWFIYSSTSSSSSQPDKSIDTTATNLKTHNKEKPKSEISRTEITR